MKILILEDNKYRIEHFKNMLNKKFIECEIVFTDNVKKAKKIFNDNQWDIIFLDHDLDDRVYVDSNEPNTGYQFAKFLNKNLSNTIPIIIIHTLNPVGARNMMNELKTARYIPFHLIQSFIENQITILEKNS